MSGLGIGHGDQTTPLSARIRRIYLVLLVLILVAFAITLWQLNNNTDDIVKNRHVTCDEFREAHPHLPIVKGCRHI